MFPPMPPEVTEQAPQRSAFMPAEGGAPGQGANPATEAIQSLLAKIQELQQWAGDTLMLINQVHPPLKALMVPIAQAGKAMQAQLEDLLQRGVGSNSPRVNASPPPNPAMGAEAGMMPPM